MSIGWRDGSPGTRSTFALLNGTPFAPDLTGVVLLLEDDYETGPHHFDRWLTSILQQPGADAVSGLVIGRFQRRSGMTRDLLQQIVAGQPSLRGVPGIANVDVGHTSPMATIPIGADTTLEAHDDHATIMVSHPYDSLA